MAMTHEQIDEQMVDFLYGELPADARAAFEAHVAGCERCRREVESFAQVRAVARTLLDEAPPARAHDAILRAAREAAAAAAAKPTKEKTAKEETRKAEPARASLWDWLRGRWAFPTLATVGAMTVLILGSRLFLNPNTAREIGRPAPVSEPAARAPAPSTPTAAPEASPALEPTEPAKAPASAAPARRRAVAEAKKARSDVARHAAPAQGGGAGIGRSGASLKDRAARRARRLQRRQGARRRAADRPTRSRPRVPRTSQRPNLPRARWRRRSPNGTLKTWRTIVWRRKRRRRVPSEPWAACARTRSHHRPQRHRRGRMRRRLGLRRPLPLPLRLRNPRPLPRPRARGPAPWPRNPRRATRSPSTKRWFSAPIACSRRGAGQRRRSPIGIYYASSQIHPRPNAGAGAWPRRAPRSPPIVRRRRSR